MAGRPRRDEEPNARELLALEAFAAGCTYAQISVKLSEVYGYTSADTVTSILKRLRMRMRAATSVHMISVAYQRGYLRLPDEVIQRLYTNTGS